MLVKNKEKTEKMPRGQQATTVVDRPLRTTRKNGGADQPIVQKPPRAKRVADENAGNEAKSRKRAAFGDLTNVSFLKKCMYIFRTFELRVLTVISLIDCPKIESAKGR